MGWILSLLFIVAQAATPYPTSVTLTAADGTAIHAIAGVPAKSDKGVVFVHTAGRAKEDWQLVADKAFRKGLMVAVPDLRGHGANVSGTPPTLTPQDYAAMVGDVRAAVAHLRAQGATKISIVGAELGANLALNAAAEEPDVVSLVLLSPGLDYKGVITPDAIRRYGARPVLLVASKDDAYGARSAQALDAQAQGEHQLQLYDAAGKGTKMFNREPALEGIVLGFVASHWTAPKAAPPPTATKAPAIDVAPSEMKTSGPEDDIPAPPPPQK